MTPAAKSELLKTLSDALEFCAGISNGTSDVRFDEENAGKLTEPLAKAIAIVSAEAPIPSRVINADTASPWKPIETLDKTNMQFVLVYEDGAQRAYLWNPCGFWEFGQPRQGIVGACDICSNPTHWMELPESPIVSAEEAK